MLREPVAAEQVFLHKNMSNEQAIIDSSLSKDYQYGFVTDIDSDTLPPGLNEDVIRVISLKKKEPEWLLNWRLRAYKNWLKMKEPESRTVLDRIVIVIGSGPKEFSPFMSMSISRAPSKSNGSPPRIDFDSNASALSMKSAKSLELPVR